MVRCVRQRRPLWSGPASRAAGGLRRAWRRGDKGVVGDEDRSDSAVNRDRVIAWGRELRLAHETLRRHLDQIRRSLPEAGFRPVGAGSELGLFCVGFCGALSRHHRGEDGSLFPRILLEHSELAPVIAQLIDDHRVLAALLTDLERASATGSPNELVRHLDGIEALMTSHFAFEERRLVAVLDATSLAGLPAEFLGDDLGTRN